ncbi:MT-A70-domain-containing protein [Saccharata proteae CBS 121410]|uniref:MT-A70-domain-containing protein n=1 Tax=Saccharata proteae CBS 121410 TaxID=1314787 RepID=A0A6A5YAY5_9PEZI|nr:MT-A70-domain-containing protein [Saccharata proteae CBS 121410]
MQHILYQNAEQSVTLIDVPASIAAAQGTKDRPSQATLLSVPPAQKPFVIPNEPRTAKAKAQQAVGAFDAKLTEQHESYIQTALAEISGFYEGKWCLPRLTYHPKDTAKKRSMDDDLTDNEESLENNGTDKVDVEDPKATDPLAALFDKLCSKESSHFELRARDPDTGLLLQTQPRPKPLTEETFNVKWDQWYSINHNTSNGPALLDIRRSEDPSGEIHTFILPPQSSFSLSAAYSRRDFRGGIDQANHVFGTPKTFPLIVLDPPWPNRSAKRAHQYTTWTVKFARRILTAMDLDQLIEPNGVIAIWITNKAQIRDVVLGPDGLFEKWNVSFFEEWLYIKTTATGEPISPLDSAYRKPYESLLLARAPPHKAMTAMPVENVATRVIVGVPDLHSRKPCLKTLFASLIDVQTGDDYQALEIFARHCVAGWFSWGNEVLKYNSDSFWSRS